MAFFVGYLAKDTMNRQYGLVSSVLIHALIFLIPVSMVVKRHMQDIELFVSIQDAHVRKEAVVRKDEIVRPVVEKRIEPEKVQEIVRSVEIPVPEEREEEAVEPMKKVAKPPAELPTQPTPSPVVRVAPAEIPSDPVDTEFGAAMAPSFLHREWPVYPVFARKLGKEGKVVLRLTIDERGNLLDVEVVKTAGYGFVDSAVDAIRKSTFLPAKQKGKPVASRALLPVRFTLRRSS